MNKPPDISAENAVYQVVFVWNSTVFAVKKPIFKKQAFQSYHNKQINLILHQNDAPQNTQSKHSEQTNQIKAGKINLKQLYSTQIISDFISRFRL